LVSTSLSPAFGFTAHLFYAGLRLGEQPVLRVEDVDLTDRLLLVLRGLAP
jgi:hypothetical protein